jgi:hypothetical protein
VTETRRAALGLLLIAAACGPPAEVVERERLLAAIDALRDAPSADTRRRRGLLEALERQAATTPPAVEARDACASAYRALLDADDLGTEMLHALNRGEGPPPDLPAQLREAEAKAAQARSRMPGCESALTRLRHPAAARPLP